MDAKLVRVCPTFDSRILEDMCLRKSAFYSYSFHIFRLFGFGKEEGDVYRFMITMCFCHDHQRCVMYVFISYDSVVVDFLQTIIWKISICRRWCKVCLQRRTYELYICCDRFIYLQT